MNSLEWRVKKLENKLLGQASGSLHVDRILSRSGQNSLFDQLESVARQYKAYQDSADPSYAKFVELYAKHKSLLSGLDVRDDNDVSSKAELVIAYEDELRKYMDDTKSMAKLADRVLNIEKWPDLSGYRERLEKLQTITKDQHIQSLAIDKRTEDLIELYNDIILSFKKNSALWNQKLEAYEDEDRKLDEDL